MYVPGYISYGTRNLASKRPPAQSPGVPFSGASFSCFGRAFFLLRAIMNVRGFAPPPNKKTPYHCVR